MDEALIISLLERHLNGAPLEAEEERVLHDWFKRATPEEFNRLMGALPGNDPRLYSMPAAFARRLEERMDSLEREPRGKMAVFARRWWAAASVVLLLGLGAYLWTARKHDAPPAGLAQQAADIAPGREGAILTLADGSEVTLDSMQKGVIALQNGAEAVVKNGELAYNEAGNAKGQAVYNSIRTPKGRQYTLLLPDGTKVWLNAATVIRYPTAFTGKEREVRLTGEAYFEVAENAEKPFRVNVNGRASIEVLGTHFNVNAYENEENIRTTLLEGSVAVSAGPAQRVVLKPAQQAVVSGNAAIAVRDHVDVGKATAWKNGLFDFNDASLQEVMRQLERWYDIEVVYEKGIPEAYFYGKVSKDVSFDGIQKVLKASNVRFRMEGRRLTVMP